MTATLFLLFVTLMAAVVVGLIGRYLDKRTALTVFAGLLVWFVYIGWLGYSGIARNSTMRPPGIVFIGGPVIAFLLFFVARTFFAAPRIALAFPLWFLLGMQCFRIGVELFLHRLWIDGLIPRMLTFQGANVDIYIGLSAPFVAWLAARGPAGKKLALAWNWLGLLSLANVAGRAVLSAPGPLNRIHTEVPNLMIGTFPFLYTPGFFVPLAVVLHVLAIKAILNTRSS